MMYTEIYLLPEYQNNSLMNINKLFSYLKEDTADAHHALENTYPFSQQMNKKTFTAESYLASLRTLLAFHKYASPFVRALPHSLADLNKVSAVIPALNADINELTSAPLPTLTFVGPKMQISPESQLACAYVWIGSSMGARIIARWMTKENLQLPINYYAAMTSVGTGWAEFREQAVEYAQGHEVDIHQVSQFANQLFSGLMDTAKTNWPSE